MLTANDCALGITHPLHYCVWKTVRFSVVVHPLYVTEALASSTSYTTNKCNHLSD